jgi:tRNA(fMet)-specific endonuclease VapC
MLDANALIALLSGASASLQTKAVACDEGELVVSAIAFAEVAVGSWRGKRPSMIVLDQLPRQIPVVPFDHIAAKHYAQLPFRRGSYDRLIAAHALSLGLTLVTSNEGDFKDIFGLRVENWAE